jgi:hypothetical protein
MLRHLDSSSSPSPSSSSGPAVCANPDNCCLAEQHTSSLEWVATSSGLLAVSSITGPETLLLLLLLLSLGVEGLIVGRTSRPFMAADLVVVLAQVVAAGLRELRGLVAGACGSLRCSSRMFQVSTGSSVGSRSLGNSGKLACRRPWPHLQLPQLLGMPATDIGPGPGRALWLHLWLLAAALHTVGGTLLRTLPLLLAATGVAALAADMVRAAPAAAPTRVSSNVGMAASKVAEAITIKAVLEATRVAMASSNTMVVAAHSTTVTAAATAPSKPGMEDTASKVDMAGMASKAPTVTASRVAVTVSRATTGADMVVATTRQGGLGMGTRLQEGAHLVNSTALGSSPSSLWAVAAAISSRCLLLVERLVVAPVPATARA